MIYINAFDTINDALDNTTSCAPQLAIVLDENVTNQDGLVYYDNDEHDEKSIEFKENNNYIYAQLTVPRTGATVTVANVTGGTVTMYCKTLNIN